MALNQIAENNLRTRPDACAVLFNGSALSFSQLYGRASRLAGWLQDTAGASKGARVALLAQNCTEYVECFAVAECAGVELVTLNYRLSAAEMLAVLDDCRPSILIFAAEYAGIVEQLKQQADYLAGFLCIGDALPWAPSYDSAVAAAAPAPQPALKDSDTAYLVYTSGTTGRPKGVTLTHGGQLAAARAIADALQLRPDDRMLLAMPLYHLGGRSMLMSHHRVGASVLVHDRFDPAAFCRDVERNQVTTTLLAPTMVMAILEYAGNSDFDLSSLRTVMYSAAPMPVALLQRAIARFGNIFLQMYGLTESGPLGTVLSKDDHMTATGEIRTSLLASAGRACSGCEIAIREQPGVDLPTGTTGEICVRSPSVMAGYWNAQAATAATLRDGWLHTGDVGYLDEEGYLFIIDRKKDMIVSGGENIYPREVEDALYRHASVLDAAVIGAPHPKWGETVKAVIVCKPGTSPTQDEIISHCRAHIASYKKPTSVEFVPALPRLPSGKIDKPALRAAFATR